MLIGKNITHINETFKTDLSIQAINEIEVVYPCTKLPDKMNLQLFFDNDKFYEKFNKLIR